MLKIRISVTGVRALAKRVAADTITQITGAAGFREQLGVPSPAPTAQEIIEKTRERLKKEVIAADAYLDAADPENERTIEARQKDVLQAGENLKMFEDLLKTVPVGFKLAPVFYSRITMEENNAIKEQYSFHVRPRFMKFVGENYGADLKALGVSDEGIERMKGGLDPEDANGNKYILNVDHIIERAGSGKMGKTPSVDPDQPGAKPTLEINHFGNFVLLPETVHEYKNKLNDLQLASDMPFGKGKWIIMMVPERDAVHHGFVAQPQPAGSKMASITGHPAGQRHNEYIVEVTSKLLAEMKDTGTIRPIVRGLVAEADQEGKTVAEMADLEARQKKPGLRQKFNAAVAKDPQMDMIVNGLVRPAVKDVAENVSQLFRKLSRDTSDRYKEQAFWDFARFFRSAAVKELRQDVEALPVVEAADMVRTFNLLEKDINALADRLDAAGKARRAANPNPVSSNDNSGKKPFRKPGGGNGGSRVKRPGERN